jgi:hypothetical protein
MFREIILLARHVASSIDCAYLCVPVSSTVHNNTLANLLWLRNHTVRPSDGKAQSNQLRVHVQFHVLYCYMTILVARHRRGGTTVDIMLSVGSPLALIPPKKYLSGEAGVAQELGW